MSSYLSEHARYELVNRTMRGDLVRKYNLQYLRSMPLKDAVDPGMTWGEFEDELAVVAHVQNGRRDR